jgi:predicted 2-oxoglutarate/Fe(II)-dependent dioxygenase YbiX
MIAEEGRTPAMQMAPVLTVPRVFEPELCRRLIDHYHEQGGASSGVMREIDGRTVGVMDGNMKRRRDAKIVDEELSALTRERISRRLAPEIFRAFQWHATRIERFMVACYEDVDQGFFNAHRDNTTSGTAHRRFAVTLNLNDDYDGGELWFPEFGRGGYKPPPGGAVVFNCSLLHAARPVTRGTRYVFVPFLYDESGAQIRQANRGKLGRAEEDVALPEAQAAE